MASSSRGFRNRDEYRKQKELEDLRKEGKVAPEKDEEGNDINPHIPQYIARSPWYLSTGGPSLRHQKAETVKDPEVVARKLDVWYERGKKAGPAATKFRKGACENCGSMAHAATDCLERPRKVRARFSGVEIAADDVISNVALDFDGKRDRWNGYDSKEYKKVIQTHERLEEERRRLRGEKMDEEFRQGDATDVLMEKKDEGTRVTVRNLRIREDTAKYLRNLDVNSAYYDPKTRSMREDPTPEVDPDDKDYAGDNFVRHTGEARGFAGLQLFTLDATERNAGVPHLQAQPSLAEAVYREFQNKREAVQDHRRQETLEKYGGTEHLVSSDVVQAMGQSEAFVEYTRDGRVIKGVEPARPVSKYPEGILELNHTNVWGSYYQDGRWGFACCHQTVRMAYCTGEAGRKAREEADRAMQESQVSRLSRQETDVMTQQSGFVAETKPG
uniref:Pre-mRNA-splicing factor SLU7 n=1 Tax=Compsopogon caeruleus TaxID=31354 RepID=A0A7S1XGY3_9RHOD|mmetsp:Transcript_8293/g.16843  ORF Transcript_8293/g.16843 Transcript_8293/m.16843 type:complete len:444 (+) Transcript_8293:121-1452(+)|eukprot:CAMPEP_0184681326 /NCGR_PEP_ID=MMETSP0312-20130426/4291_1 /TAXON_ID=31354 /ORGANISM="Compsopogon coeruleus, Strain SAG 36.94" /LENGTH=443 /DNA_ID=CAMNT_0027132085 /DNA_START=77 /DNA_END=1408 /DNA_ORIENTATION=+